MSKELSRYIIKKRIMATSPRDAILKEKKMEAQEVWLDEVQPPPANELVPAMGFDLQSTGEICSEWMKGKKKKKKKAKK